ncbi:MAG: hypothetical protein ACHBN1_14420 [Heteroscytonema crispum UTEX LB 1556]
MSIVNSAHSITINHQPSTINPRGVTLVPRYRVARNQSPGSGKRHLRNLGRPQDRSGGLTKGAPSPSTMNYSHCNINLRGQEL